MILRMLRGALVLVSSAIIIPYTIAIVSNILHGWPQCKNRYSRALNPRKVLGLNHVLLQMLRDKTTFLFLYLKWKKFYKNADPSRLYKNLAFGRNDCTLDIYLPWERNPAANLPVVIFVYGGAWSSGNKSSYGLLCTNIASHTQSIVVCPNYSTYPKGYVDDMIQDIVDCISWVIDNIQEYGGDKNKIILIGHSAGAHLSVMAILELLHDERLSVQSTFKFTPALDQLEELSFAESHYGKRGGLLEPRNDGHQDSSGSSESFAVVSENGSSVEQCLLTDSGGTSLFGSSLNSDNNANPENGASVSENEGNGQERVPHEENKEGAAEIENETLAAEGPLSAENNGEGQTNQGSHSGGSQGDDEEEEDSGDNDSVITVRPKDIDRHATLVDLCKAVKAFIGLAGVYSIKDHFQHESWRGIEDVSCMCRAHYGEDHFARFSPKEIIHSLGRCLSLPLMVLVHGTEDYVSPLSATLTFAEALSDISANVKVRVIPECNHYEVCLDLMDRHRKFYSHVMGIIMETISAVS
ncbi:uncharacterized protein LOC106068271 [Biomphalaria glabrata]|uniref:Uncharacterized protein LOC106068271 n=1 Tax=Biomphalaria glabrata TaxID=6526 RepID=A0A9U8ECY8_BIOGL|nr:uncharacterized protein LOC106068271 [Biomphalaria glabrata]XP_055876212.1 uncharacterized protein LOC106068271 [Biomphalaria glabrata]